MQSVWSYILLCVPSVFIIVDPPGAVPVFISMTSRDPLEHQRAMAKRACLVAGALLTLFALSGNFLFHVFGISVAALRIAGGFILFGVGAHMLAARPVPQRQTEEEVQDGIAKQDIALVPLAIPMLSGPGAIATVISLGVQAHSIVESAVLIGTIVLTMVCTFLLLSNAHWFKRVFGETGVKIMERIMGLILAAIAVQFVLDGLVDALPPLAKAWAEGMAASPAR